MQQHAVHLCTEISLYQQVLRVGVALANSTRPPLHNAQAAASRMQPGEHKVARDLVSLLLRAMGRTFERLPKEEGDEGILELRQQGLLPPAVRLCYRLLEQPAFVQIRGRQLRCRRACDRPLPVRSFSAGKHDSLHIARRISVACHGLYGCRGHGRAFTCGFDQSWELQEAAAPYMVQAVAGCTAKSAGSGRSLLLTYRRSDTAVAASVCLH